MKTSNYLFHNFKVKMSFLISFLKLFLLVSFSISVSFAAIFTVHAEPITLSMTANPDPVRPGEQIYYTLTDL